MIVLRIERIREKKNKKLISGWKKCRCKLRWKVQNNNKKFPRHWWRNWFFWNETIVQSFVIIWTHLFDEFGLKIFKERLQIYPQFEVAALSSFVYIHTSLAQLKSHGIPSRSKVDRFVSNCGPLVVTHQVMVIFFILHHWLIIVWKKSIYQLWLRRKFSTLFSSFLIS